MKISYSSILKKIVCFICLTLYISHYAIGQRQLSNPTSSPEAKALYCYIQSISGKKILSGQMWSGWGFDELAYIQTNTGKSPAIMGYDFIQESVNNKQVTLATNWWKKGGIPTMMWHFGAPGHGEGYTSSQIKITIDNCFIPGTPEYVEFWAELTKKADHLQALRDANIPILWRPFHELNGGWFWWGKEGGTQFKRLWVTMYDYFVKTRKLNNLIWVLCYTGSPDGSFFPGNQYVDIAGGDEYATTNDPQLALYNKVKSSIVGNVMPITLHECGIPPDPNKSLSTGAMFSWWMIWHTSFLQNMDKTYLNSTFNHDVILTLDELPNIMTSCGGSTNPVPSVTLNSPTNNSSVCLGISVTINATTAISRGSVSKVDFYDGNRLLVSDNTAPYSYTWAYPATGIHTVRAIATSALNVTSAESLSSITVNPPTPIEPFMQINGGTWTAQATATLCSGGNLAIGPHPLNVAGWSWNGPGNFTANTREISFPTITAAKAGLYVVSYLDVNGCTSSSNINAAVNASPVVTITSPANNANLASSAISITANVVGTGITNVQFYNSSTLVSTDATAPYGLLWDSKINGNYTLSVKASNTNCADTATVKVYVNMVTGLVENESSNSIACFPNPFNHFFTIKAPGKFDYVIYDLTGNEADKGSAEHAITIGSNLLPGIYSVKILDASKSNLIKISKY
ncbi:MAG: T9SS type A sorting domain-containing protein [Opitutaceae bacterium]|nr:T9SS type A sorting domain-containing protein [Cytophagales bacterium]